MKIKSFIVDAFTTALFKGNPAGVCLLDASTSLTEAKMILIAKEFGFSETAFVAHLAENIYHIRYFSPKMEIPLCGHATMASAKVLFSEGAKDLLIFKTHFGATLEIKQQQQAIEMYFPILGLEAATISQDILQALGIETVMSCAYNREHNIISVEIADSLALANLMPDYGKLRSIETGINGVVVTAKSISDDYDYEYRYFWPWSGTDEDPVTGAVQSFLAPYWHQKLNKRVMQAFQCSERTGQMQVTLTSDKVIITGNAVIFSEGNITI